MSLIEKLASAQGHRNDAANIVLAKEIAGSSDKKAVKELVENLGNKNKAIQSDCIKTLYEIGEIKPSLTAPYADTFLALLNNNNNRLQWGAMTALSAITAECPKLIYHALPIILKVAEKGSVITKDHMMKILTILGGIKEYADDAWQLIMEQLSESAENQFPTYAEHALPLVTPANKVAFLNVLIARAPGIGTESKRKRVEKLIKKLQK